MGTTIEMPLSLTEAATALRDGATTSVELTAAALQRADDLDPRLGLHLTRVDGRAMDAASRADADFATGRDRGILQGIPIGVEQAPAAGAAEEWAGPSPVLDPAWLTEPEGPAVARIRRSGAVITGTLSGSGTGVGVAAGLFLAGVGPDTDDSIRIPAAACGISGLVPTSGVAPLARSARDCAAVLEVIGRRDVAGEYLGALCGSLAGLRLGVDRAAAPDLDDADPLVAGLVGDAIAVLGDLGADLIEAADPAEVDAVIGAASTPERDRPVLILPMGFGSGGQPRSLQITGHSFGEATVLRVGDAYQQITDWHRQAPGPGRHS